MQSQSLSRNHLQDRVETGDTFGGLRKRLSDYTRASDSARKHTSGRLMHEHASQLHIELLITGSDPKAVEVAKKLEGHFVGLHQPEWNTQLK